MGSEMCIRDRCKHSCGAYIRNCSAEGYFNRYVRARDGFPCRSGDTGIVFCRQKRLQTGKELILLSEAPKRNSPLPNETLVYRVYVVKRKSSACPPCGLFRFLAFYISCMIRCGSRFLYVCMLYMYVSLPFIFLFCMAFKIRAFLQKQFSIQHAPCRSSIPPFG